MAATFTLVVIKDGNQVEFGYWSANFWPRETDLDFKIDGLTSPNKMDTQTKFRVVKCDKDEKKVYVTPYYPGNDPPDQLE